MCCRLLAVSLPAVVQAALGLFRITEASFSIVVPSKKLGIHFAVQMDRVREGNIAEIINPEDPSFDELVGLGQDFRGILNVPVTNVRAEHGIKAGSQRVDFGVECPGYFTVVRFTAEVEARHEEIVDILFGLDRAGGPFVQVFGILGLDEVFGSVISGCESGSSVTPPPITSNISRWFSGSRVSTKALLVDLRSFMRATRFIISSMETCLMPMILSLFQRLRSKGPGVACVATSVIAGQASCPLDGMISILVRRRG
ncbi:MAG: hypothetical protein CL569_03450 [Alphaproteobacteria bacterium]|nr:hypothetical protein [Alphaproteobacteria bacterium]